MGWAAAGVGLVVGTSTALAGQPAEAEGKVEDGKEQKKEEEKKDPAGEDKLIADVPEQEESKI